MNDNQCFILRAAAAFSGVSAYNGAMPGDLLALVDEQELVRLIEEGLLVRRPITREHCMESQGVALTKLGSKVLKDCPEEN